MIICEVKSAAAKIREVVTDFVIIGLDSSFAKYHPKNPTFDDDEEVEKERSG